MKITDVKVRKIFGEEERTMRAVASVTFDGQFALHDVKIINSRDRLFVVMPSRKNADGTFRDVAHPITQEFRNEIEAAVFEAYEKALAAKENEEN